MVSAIFLNFLLGVWDCLSLCCLFQSVCFQLFFTILEDSTRSPAWAEKLSIKPEAELSDCTCQVLIWVLKLHSKDLRSSVCPPRVTCVKSQGTSLWNNSLWSVIPAFQSCLLPSNSCLTAFKLAPPCSIFVLSARPPCSLHAPGFYHPLISRNLEGRPLRSPGLIAFPPWCSANHPPSKSYPSSFRLSPKGLCLTTGFLSLQLILSLSPRSIPGSLVPS